jgi:hypothetical protein
MRMKRLYRVRCVRLFLLVCSFTLYASVYVSASSGVGELALNEIFQKARYGGFTPMVRNYLRVVSCGRGGFIPSGASAEKSFIFRHYLDRWSTSSENWLTSREQGLYDVPHSLTDLSKIRSETPFELFHNSLSDRFKAKNLIEQPHPILTHAWSRRPKYLIDFKKDIQLTREKFIHGLRPKSFVKGHEIIMAFESKFPITAVSMYSKTEKKLGLEKVSQRWIAPIEQVLLTARIDNYKEDLALFDSWLFEPEAKYDTLAMCYIPEKSFIHCSVGLVKHQICAKTNNILAGGNIQFYIESIAFPEEYQIIDHKGDILSTCWLELDAVDDEGNLRLAEALEKKGILTPEERNEIVRIREIYDDLRN